MTCGWARAGGLTGDQREEEVVHGLSSHGVVRRHSHGGEPPHYPSGIGGPDVLGVLDEGSVKVV